MKYYKTLDADGYITALEKRATVGSGTEITETEFNEINAMLRTRPAAESGYMYRLHNTLEWVQVEKPVPTPDEVDLTADEALSILMGGETA